MLDILVTNVKVNNTRQNKYTNITRATYFIL